MPKQTVKLPVIMWQDEHFVAITKPAGMVSMNAQTVTGLTVQDWFEEWRTEHPSIVADGWPNLVPGDFSPEFGTPQEIFQQRGGVAHRIDKDTSGIMLLARHPAALLVLLKLFKERLVHKQYLALVHGKFQIKSGVFSGPISRATFNRMRFAVQADGRPAETEYEVEQSWSSLDTDQIKQDLELAQINPGPHFHKRCQIYQGFSLVKCWPKTGRTHQIRVHLAAAKHPLVGDKVYAGKKRQQLDAYWCQRQFLHAAELRFEHPFNQEEVHIVAPLPEDLQKTLSYLI